jgi:hypothetical protein
VTGQHYATTRTATAGPDVVAATVGSVPGGLPTDLFRLEQFSRAPGVSDHSGPFPVTPGGRGDELTGQRRIDRAGPFQFRQAGNVRVCLLRA